jgi:hypothetical protein
MFVTSLMPLFGSRGYVGRESGWAVGRFAQKLADFGCGDWWHFCGLG